jgi:hypothetical protein
MSALLTVLQLEGRTCERLVYGKTRVREDL